MRGWKRFAFVCVMILCCVSFRSWADLEDVDIDFPWTVEAGEEYGTVNVYDFGDPLFDPTVVDFYGLTHQLETHDSSIVNIRDGGRVMDYFGPYPTHESHLWGSSTVNVYEGGAFDGGSSAYLTLHDTSTLSIRGGDTHCFLYAEDSSVINLYDGILNFGFGLGDNSTLNIYGGRTGVFLGNSGLVETATLNIYGTQFEYEAEATWLDDPGQGWISRLSGIDLNGNELSLLGMPDPATHPNIHLIPEPAGILLLGWGAVLIRRRRQG